MKKQLSLFLLILTTTLFFSCLKKPSHSIRISNNYPVQLNQVKIGSVDYGNISTGQTTTYKPVEEGSHTLSGYGPNNVTLSGSVSVQGKGKHKWSLTIQTSGGLNIKEDK